LSWERKKNSLMTQINIKALSRVPIMSRDQVNNILEFVKSLVEFIANMGLEKLKDIENAKKIRKVENELTKREQYRIITENSSDMIAVLSPQNKFIFVSPACMKIGGYKPQEVVGKILFDFCHPDDRELLTEIFIKLIKFKDNTFSYVFRFMRKDGSYVWVETNGWALYDEKTKELQEIQTSSRDISERKKMEIEILTAKTEAEQANHAKSEFLANMSHEIRTPLNAVIGFSELLDATILDTKQKSFVGSINTSGKSLLTLINDILDLSKIEAGMMKIKLAPVNPKNIFNELEQIFSASIRKKNLEFILDVDENIPTALLLDETRLRQVLLNLMGNAVKFTDKGSITLQVKKSYSDITDGSRLNLIIAIKDTGIGIPQNQYTSIFESFKQQSGQSDRKYGGTGLGLSITKKLVEIMKGKISVSSVVGKGSTFMVELFDVDLAASSELILEETNVHVPDSIFEEAQILVVDDVESNRLLLKEMLTKKGLKVISAENGYEATTISEEIEIDVIIMDIRMPVMDGYEACEIIKSKDTTKNIPVIALSASTFGTSKEDERVKFFDAYLPKPVSSKQLIDELKKYLKIKSIDEVVPPPRFQLKDQHIDTPHFDANDDLKKLIEQEILPVARKLEVVLKIAQVGELAEELERIGIQFQIQEIKDCANQLMEGVQSYDVSKIKSSLKDTIELLNNI